MKKIVSVLMLFSLLCTPISAHSEDRLLIYPDTQKQIDNLISDNDENKEYIQDVIGLFNSKSNITSKEYNDLLLDVISTIEKQDRKTDQDLNNAYIKMASEILSSDPFKEAYDNACNLYSTGILLVIAKGANHTADYMKHAVVPYEKLGTSYKPSNVTHKKDKWAETLCTNEAFTAEVTTKFENEILATGDDYGVVDGHFYFTSKNSPLDAFTALHEVDYAVTFTKKSNGYSAVYKITDTYNFDDNKVAYDNFAVDFGNKYCHGMQVQGYIKPFKITITY
ncbi:hypothetical protein [Faecalimonas sp.]